MLSYSSLKTSPKVTLPSVEMWGTNMNILKDPPKSLYTRRIDKVSDTQQITLQEAEATDRRLENIKIYARNVNPMVGVSYNNYGNTQSKSGQTQATLPYKVQNVRPPLLSQYDLQPLSRLPRDWFYTFSNPEFPQLVQNLQCNEGSRCIQQKTVVNDIMTNKLRQVYLPLDDSETLKLNRTPLYTRPHTNHKISLQKEVSDPIIGPNTISKSNKMNNNLPSTTNKSLNILKSHMNNDSHSLLTKIHEKSQKNKTLPFKTNSSKKLTSIHPKTIFQTSKKIRNLQVESKKHASMNNLVTPLPTNIRVNQNKYQGSAETSKDIRYFSSGQILDNYLPHLQSKLPSYTMTTNLSGNGDSDPKEHTVSRQIPTRNLVKDVTTPSLFYFEPQNTHLNTKIGLKNTLKRGELEPIPSSVPSVNIENANERMPLYQNNKKMNRKTELTRNLRNDN